jgi:hypothetical protein
MPKPKKLRDQAREAVHDPYPSEAVIEAWLAGHRAGLRLTKAERAVLKTTLDWADGKAGHHNVLDAVIEYRKAKKVRK